MNTHMTLRRAGLLSLTALLALLGGACINSGTLPTDSVAIVFVNNAGFEVDPTVNGERMDTVTPGKTARPILFDCLPGQQLDFSGSVRTNTQTLPSPYDVTFTDGDNFSCGQTVQVTYVMNNGNLDLDGISY